MKNATRTNGTIRKTLAAAALAAAITAPVAVATASPAGAAGSCPTWMCGSNHNETVGRDRRRVRKALAALTLSAAGAAASVMLTAEAAHAGIQTNHNGTVGRDRRQN